MLSRFKALSLGLLFCGVFSQFSAFSMDNEPREFLASKTYKSSGALRIQEHVQPNLLPIKNEILEEQYQLIEGAKLTLWGVGLFAGDEIISKGIRLITDSEWSHVGLILEDQNKELYCFESTGSASQILKKKMLPQVQIHKWEDSVDSYDGRVAKRQFIFSGENKVDPDKVTHMVKDLIGTPYERDLSTLISSIRRNNKEESISTLFCSELVAKVMMDLGYLSNQRVSDNYLPKDFSSKEFIPLQGITMETEIVVKELEKNKGCCIII